MHEPQNTVLSFPPTRNILFFKEATPDSPLKHNIKITYILLVGQHELFDIIWGKSTYKKLLLSFDKRAELYMLKHARFG